MKLYLELLKEAFDSGADKKDRTGTGTYSLFGRQIRYDLSKGFPLLTTKKISAKTIIHELLWFLSGDTNIKYLHDNNVSIWDEWATPNGDLGAIYGAQWRKWPDGKGGHIDQIEKLIDGLRNNPDSRRHLFHAWNVAYLPDVSISPQDNVLNGKMALPPCHLLYQFYVVDGKLSGLLYIRSNDLFLGHPYNCASMAFLTHMIAQQCGYEVGEIIISMGDVHLYKNHVDQALIQLKRSPLKLPTLELVRNPENIFDYHIDDFKITNYKPYSAIKADISV